MPIFGHGALPPVPEPDSERPNPMRSRFALQPYLRLGALAFFVSSGLLLQTAHAQIHLVESAARAGVDARGESNGAAFGDVDGDGWPDLLVTHTARDEPSLLYRNQRDGTFAEGVFSWSAPPDAVGGLFVDFDADGDQDLYVIVHRSPNQLLRNDAGAFTLLPQPPDFHESSVSTAAFFADLDADGRAELFSTHRLWQANQWAIAPGTTAMVDRSRLVSPLRAGDDSFGATPFDFDGDGDLDVYICSFLGANLLHQNDGASQFRTIPGAAGMASDGASIAALPADVDGDGHLDLLVLNAVAQSNELFVGHPDGSRMHYQDLAPSSGLAAPGNSSGGAWADFDNDGDEDLIISNVSMPIQVFRHDDGASFTDVSSAAIDGPLPASGTTGVTVDDIDRDGDIDVFLTAPEGQDVLLVNESGSNDWIRIDLGHDAAMAGTRIEVAANGRRQARVFTVASSIGTQHGSLLHFGLGPQVADSVEVRVVEPGGRVRALKAAAGQQAVLPRRGLINDLAVARVLSPDLAPGWGGFRPRIEVTNHGTQTSSATQLVVRIAGPGRSFERRLVVGPMAAGTTRELVSDAWRPDHPGLWELDVHLDVVDDVMDNNDWKRRYHLHEFEDVAATLGVDDDGPGWAGAFADYDNDGDLDLYVSNGGSLGDGDNILYRNDGAAGFSDVTDAAGVADADNGTGVVFADFDRDGDQDLFIAKGGFSSFGQPNRMFRNEGTGLFRDISAEAGLDVSRSSYAAVVGDYDLDGFLDLYVSQLRGQEATFYKNRQGRFEDVTRTKRILSFFQYSGAAAAFSDYDNDGDIDLYAGVFGDFDRFYAAVGDTAYAVASVGGEGDMVGVALGDYDEDGDLDVYTVNQNGRSALYQNHIALSTFLDVGSESGTENMALGTGCAFVDFDSDGDLDLMVVNAFTSNLAYVNLGDGTFLDQAQAFGLADTSRTRAVLVGDIDGDGDPDAYVINEGTHNRLYANGGGSNGWVSVHARGVVSNPDAVGARLTAWVGGRSMLREVNGTAGMSYSSRVTHFGLGPARQIDSLVVQWPGGTVDRYGPSRAGTSLQLVEGGPMTAVHETAAIGAVPQAVDLEAVYPNPFNAEGVVRFRLPASAVVQLVIYNALGQKVRQLIADQVRSAGTHEVRWDGRNDGEDAAASGVYYARLQALGEQRIRPLVLLK